jgi:hypothetical protein
VLIATDAILRSVKARPPAGKTRSAQQYLHISKCTLPQTRPLSWRQSKLLWSKQWRNTTPPTTLFMVSWGQRKNMVPHTLSLTPHKVQRVRKTALKLASDPSISSRSPDLLVIELSALLHDVLDKKYVPESLSSDPYAFFLPCSKNWIRSTPPWGSLLKTESG